MTLLTAVGCIALCSLLFGTVYSMTSVTPINSPGNDYYVQMLWGMGWIFAVIAAVLVVLGFRARSKKMGR